MPRDDDYIRELLFEAADSNDTYIFAVSTLNPDPETLKRLNHAKWLVDAGYFETPNGDAYRITSQGHDYAAAIRDDTIWKKTKGAAAKAGGVGLGVMKDIAVGYVRQKLIESGVPL